MADLEVCFFLFRCLIVSHFQTASIHHVSIGHAIYISVIFDMCRAHVMNRSRSPMKALAENRSCAENRSYDSSSVFFFFANSKSCYKESTGEPLIPQRGAIAMNGELGMEIIAARCEIVGHD